MRRRAFIAGLGSAAALPILSRHVARAQGTKPHHVGVILQGDPWYEVVDGLRDGLNRLRLVEGRDFVLDIRDSHGDLHVVGEAAASLEQQKVSLIYSVATSVTLAAKRGTKTTPIVFVAGTDPVAFRHRPLVVRNGRKAP